VNLKITVSLDVKLCSVIDTSVSEEHSAFIFRLPIIPSLYREDIYVAGFRRCW
jgi:hypothetical protein